MATKQILSSKDIIEKCLAKGESVKKRIDTGLYFRISDEGTAFWILRYSANGKRRELTLGRYGKGAGELTLSKAKAEAVNKRAEVNKGIDLIAEKKRPKQAKYKTVNDVAQKWLEICRRELKNPQIPERVYRKEIAPRIGDLAVTRVKPIDILDMVEQINDSGRPTIANDALGYCKQIFNRAIKEGAITFHPAGALTIKDAGGSEKSRKRFLTMSEIKITLEVMRENSHSFTRENYIAFCLLLVLGVRKGELIAAKWEEFDFDKNIWHLPEERTKTGKAISTPLSSLILPWFQELSIRANGAEFLFPSRRLSKRRGYISDDTLNHALAKLFGNDGYIKKSKKKLPNLLGEAGIKHFVVHDLRRTCRSLLAENKVLPHIAEKCLNHKLKGVEGIYDQYDYFEERSTALDNLAKQITILT
ncbi:MAG: site-specific integrase [Shewanella psychromarinicola]|uniref:tyrosine-type recombinase/integrase n=1 Tax=Shewanella psychromarinicola TaxID=2487742 RepID=UPI003002E34A